MKNKNGEFGWIRHFIAAAGEKDMGFCQFYEYKCGGETWHGDVEAEGTYSIDYFIGEEAFLSKGYGKGIIRLLSERIFSLPSAKRIIVQPEPGNSASCRALVSAGFVFDGRNALYILESPGPD